MSLPTCLPKTSLYQQRNCGLTFPGRCRDLYPLGERTKGQNDTHPGENVLMINRFSYQGQQGTPQPTEGRTELFQDTKAARPLGSRLR